MSSGILEWLAGTEDKKEAGYSIAPGVVTDNINLLSEGRVQVHIPSLPSFDPWARLVGMGGGPSRGFIWVPQIDDEVLVAFNANDERDAYILGGMWSMLNRPPISLTTDFLTKRVLMTGMTEGVGHEIEFDDAEQSVSITTSTSQTITLDPTKIEISAFEGTVKITLDAGPPPSITLETDTGDINLKAPLGTVSIQGMDVDIQGTASASLSTDGTCTIEGLEVDIN
jgi:phage baseplate assembly protein gpV